MLAELKPNSWDETVIIARFLRGFIFRGQKNTQWELKSGFERACHEYNMPVEDQPYVERGIIEAFKRRAHHYIASPPDDDLLEWVALLQHHGGVTRLLDFSRSFYVAAFFAMENAPGDGAVWAIHTGPLQDKFWESDEERRRSIAEDERRITNEWANAGKRVIIVEPQRMSERLSIQQGLFLYPCDTAIPFMDCLAASMHTDLTDTYVIDHSNPMGLESIGGPHTPHVIKIIIPRVIHTEALQDLEKMNVTAASLFPGLDGFARSLITKIRRFDGRWTISS
jgi:hypothetical protein